MWQSVQIISLWWKVCPWIGFSDRTCYTQPHCINFCDNFQDIADIRQFLSIMTTFDRVYNVSFFIGANAGCVSDCRGWPDGDYQSCKGCDIYATCNGGQLFDERPCPEGLVWDDKKHYCDHKSDTCKTGKMRLEVYQYIFTGILFSKFYFARKCFNWDGLFGFVLYS